MASAMDSVSCYTRRTGSTKVSGSMTSGTEKATSDTLMVTNMKVISRMERLTEKESIFGPMEKYMMESGEMESRKDMGYGEEFLEILTLVNGKIAKQMVMVFTNGRMEIVSKVNGEIVSNMVKVPIYSQMVILLLGHTSKENQTGMVSINGSLVLFTSVNLKKVSNMVKENGKNNKIH